MNICSWLSWTFESITACHEYLFLITLIFIFNLKQIPVRSSNLLGGYAPTVRQILRNRSRTRSRKEKRARDMHFEAWLAAFTMRSRWVSSSSLTPCSQPGSQFLVKCFAATATFFSCATFWNGSKCVLGVGSISGPVGQLDKAASLDSCLPNPASL